jgi:TRAP transporter TAXI family solute receptor
MHHVLMVMFAVCLSVGQAQAQGIGLVTGSEFGTYIRFGHDIAKVARSKGVDIIVKESEGSLANIRRMMSQENAGLGIVQSDVLSFLTTSADASMRSISSRIRLVFPFYNEEVHLFARKDIQQLSDLNGKRVVVGTKGSGNWLTANNILRIANIRPGESLEMPPGKAVSAVLTNEADAMFYVAGKPVPVFTRIQELLENPSYAPLVRQVHFLALDDPAILNEYVASNISSQDYAWLEGNIHTAAVKAVLVSVDFSSKHNAYYSQRCAQLKNLGEAIRERFDELKNSGHPKWQEVDLEQKIGIWQQDTCSSLEKVLEENITKPEALNASMPEPNTLPAQEPDMLLNQIEKILTSESK